MQVNESNDALPSSAHPLKGTPVKDVSGIDFYPIEKKGPVRIDGQRWA